MQTYAYGFPRLGRAKEYKKGIEDFWKEGTDENAVVHVLSQLHAAIQKTYQEHVDIFPDGEMTFYDSMLDTAILGGLYSPSNLKEYYDLCRGDNALEMTKWFNTNYHYLVPDFSTISEPCFHLHRENIALRFQRGRFPKLIGPFTFLKLSKGIRREDFGRFFLALIAVYQDLLLHYEKVQIEEPAFVLDLEREEIELIKTGYQLLKDCGDKIILMTYYDAVDFMEELLSLPVSAIGLDFVRGVSSYEYIVKHGFPKEKTLIAGMVDGRNIWKTDIAAAVAKLRTLSQKIPNLMVSNAAPLYHLPLTVSGEEKLDEPLKKCIAFAEEKLAELRIIAECFEGVRAIPEKAVLGQYGRDPKVQNKIQSLRPEDFVKTVPPEERRKRHQALWKPPMFPTTTIGSFPQSAEVRKKRADYRNGRLSPADYQAYLRREIDKLIQFQEELGLDVLVHGEFERTDMVEFFAEKLSGFAVTQNGWVISYGTRVYRPPIIFGDVSRQTPMTLEEIAYAQTKTAKPVKGMLTGPVTMIAWSYCREDIPLAEVAYQIALALQEEIRDYEKAGILIVQVDEPAFREKAPLKRRDWDAYFDWAVRAFNLATNTRPETQIHTHMCYSEFGEIVEYIERMDFDVISIEASRSKGDIIDAFEGRRFDRQIGLGVWDIHSPAVPPVEKMVDIVHRALRNFPANNFWINPDCGLKTRDWSETKASLRNLIETAKILRKQYARQSR
jgi:5-methyltetrahydropteroyltriglutamate--homocysteine methyltransferase